MVNPLARVVMNNVVNKTNPSSNIGSIEKVNNLTHKEQDLIVDLIKGEKEIKERKHIATMMTLDEAAERIKGSR